jgi:hypothetical protein
MDPGGLSAPELDTREGTKCHGPMHRSQDWGAGIDLDRIGAVFGRHEFELLLC